MPDSSLHPFPSSKSRTAWWLVVGALGAAVGLFLYSFVGTFVLGLFVYYGVRPLHDRLVARLDSRALSATVTMLAVVLPVLALLTYAGVMAIQEMTRIAGPNLADALAQRLPVSSDSLEVLTARPLEALSGLRDVGFDSLQRSLRTVLDTVLLLGTGLLHLTLALSFAFFLLRDGPRLANWFRSDVRGEESTAYAYLEAVDEDLETVYFGNVLTVLLVTVAAVLLYNGFVFLAPSTTLPAPTLLAILTGLATFIPLVVGKLVYVPVTVYLTAQAVRGGTGLWVPVAFLVACFLLLDLLPQTVLRPLVSGRSLHGGLVLFAYVLGAALFGWYGLFLGPLVAVLAVQAAKLVLPELAHGDPVTPATSDALDIGSDPPDDAADGPDGPDEPDDEDPASDDERTTGTGG